MFTCVSRKGHQSNAMLLINITQKVKNLHRHRFGGTFWHIISKSLDIGDFSMFEWTPDRQENSMVKHMRTTQKCQRHHDVFANSGQNMKVFH